MVVSMRSIPGRIVSKAVEITSMLPAVHGSPVHIGDPAAIGIGTSRSRTSATRDDQGREVPVFWACGVTPQAAALATKPEIMITHSPGHMFVGASRLDDPGVHIRRIGQGMDYDPIANAWMILCS